MSPNRSLFIGVGASAIALALAYHVVLSRRKRAKAASSDSSESSTGGVNDSLYEVVFVLGGPGSGKGTQCALIVENFEYEHLSAGDLLRAEKATGSETADMINEYIKEGKIVPAEVTVGLLKKAMAKSEKSKFLIDGFPRNPENLSCWESMMASYAKVDFLLFLDCPEEVMQERLLSRGETSGRSDDNIESIRKRFVTYKESTMPIIEYFEKQGKTRRILADRSVDDVFADVRGLLE